MDEILNLIESVSEEFPSYSSNVRVLIQNLFTNNTFYMIHIHYNIDELISSFRWPEHEVSTKSALDLHRSYTSTADSRLHHTRLSDMN